MGLDMSLYRANKKIGTFKDVLKINSELFGANSEKYKKEYDKFMFEKGPENYKWKSILGEVAYWRKANAIHKWFVDNIQDGIDDCEYYLVTKENIQELQNIVKKVINSCNLISGKVYAGIHYENKEPVVDYVDGLVIEDSTTAQELLPTEEGVFFGNTDYDEFYYRNLLYTFHICESILNFFPFDEYYLIYNSCW